MPAALFALGTAVLCLNLSAIFLRDIEQVTLKIVLGACLIIIGVALVALWK